MKTVITSNDKTRINFAELKHYGGLFRNLAKRDFLVRYKQAFAGLMWALIKPMVGILVFGYISSKIAGDENTSNSYLTVASAMLLWQLFSSVFNDVSNSIISNANLFSKVYFPKIIIPLSTLLVCVVDFLISLLILIALFIITGEEVRWQIVLAPFFVLLTLINGLGIGLYFTTINVKYRDVKFIVPLLLQVGMYVSPVIFSTKYYLDRIPTYLHWLFCLNPMVGAIDGFRYSLLGGEGIYSPVYFAASLMMSFLFLIIGLKYFYKFERNFTDYI